MKNIGAKVIVYCDWCKRYFNGILLDYDANRSVPYTVAVYGHLNHRVEINFFEEVEYVEWENAYEIEKKE